MSSGTDDASLPQIADAGDLERAGAGSSTERGGGVRTRLSDAMAGMKKEFYGKGPERAKTYLNDEYVFVVLEGGMTRNEETLLAAGEAHLIRQFRLRFEEAMTDTITAAVEEITGRRVLTYHSQVVFDPFRAIEIFVLDQPVG